MIEIIDYTDSYQPDFKRINLEWLNKFDLAEELDFAMLNNPQEKIIAPGGIIFLAKEKNEIIGSAALIKDHDQVYELAKMTVIQSYQGKGVSKLLMQKCLDRARELNAKKLILFSHTKLTQAIGLYMKYGFKHVEVTESPFATANVKMILDLDKGID